MLTLTRGFPTAPSRICSLRDNLDKALSVTRQHTLTLLVCFKCRLKVRGYSVHGSPHSSASAGSAWHGTGEGSVPVSRPT